MASLGYSTNTMGSISLSYWKGIIHAHNYTIHMHYPSQGTSINPLDSITCFLEFEGVLHSHGKTYKESNTHILM